MRQSGRSAGKTSVMRLTVSTRSTLKGTGSIMPLVNATVAISETTETTSTIEVGKPPFSHIELQRRSSTPSTVSGMSSIHKEKRSGPPLKKERLIKIL